jgi:hypothetical protein
MWDTDARICGTNDECGPAPRRAEHRQLRTDSRPPGTPRQLGANPDGTRSAPGRRPATWVGYRAEYALRLEPIETRATAPSWATPGRRRRGREPLVTGPVTRTSPSCTGRGGQLGPSRAPRSRSAAEMASPRSSLVLPTTSAPADRVHAAARGALATRRAGLGDPHRRHAGRPARRRVVQAGGDTAIRTPATRPTWR